ncbi:MAG: hypothetical protein KC582_01985 [Candidatus Magasanikbacteria bacterium]|nr:hypothetical protein [Candidatus Magasanikbacteria bacterium]MCA9390999.1 hypothetical protein [Candidatus Magasanikbacteria bacterium]HPF95619.1 hypothetical protein [bacterium]
MEGQKTNYTPIALAAIIAITCVGVYYVSVIDSKTRLEQETLRSKERLERDRLQAEQDAKAKEAADMQANEYIRQNNIDSCLAQAQRDYSANWDSDCASLSAKAKDLNIVCFSDQVFKGMSEDSAKVWCDSMYPPLLKTNCTLPSAMAKRWDDTKTKDEANCYSRYK